MSTTDPDPRLDRLYQLLPAVYRQRDADQKYPLQALLRVIAEQVNVVEDDMQQLYENWFIETAKDWVVPYIADLIGYRAVSDAGQAGEITTAEGRALNRVLIPRREVANTIAYRRRKGTLALLELLASDVAGWPARAVEFFKLLAWNQNYNHLHLDRAMTTGLRRVEDLDLIGRPFDPLPHTVDVRRINSHRTHRPLQHSVGGSVCVAAQIVFGNAVAAALHGRRGAELLHVQPPEPGRAPVPQAGARNRGDTHCRGVECSRADSPAGCLRDTRNFFTAGTKVLRFGRKAGPVMIRLSRLPVEAIIPADLSDWQYAPPVKHIAVDPVLGRFAFPLDQDQLPKKGVRVMYHYGFSADIGGGEYARPILDPSPRDVEKADPEDSTKTVSEKVQPKFYRVGRRPVAASSARCD